MKAEKKVTPPVVVPPPEYVITLTQVEAQHIMNVLGVIGSCGNDVSEKNTTDELYNVLHNLGLRSKGVLVRMELEYKDKG